MSEFTQEDLEEYLKDRVVDNGVGLAVDLVKREFKKTGYINVDIIIEDITTLIECDGKSVIMIREEIIENIILK